MSIVNECCSDAVIRLVRMTISIYVMSVSVSAQAVPAFARQTGTECAACHVGALGPQLTPFGIAFKLGGYTLSDGKAGKIPLSAMVMSGFTHVNTAADEPDSGLKANNNLNIEQTSLFLAGRWTDHVGSLLQVTRDGVANTNALDNVDVRYANGVKIQGKDLLLGVSLNNNPGVQDPFNTLPAWGFPYITPPQGTGAWAGTGASTLIDGGLAQTVLGASAYGLYDQHWYADLGSYRSWSSSMLVHLGEGRPADTDASKLGGNVYWRLAYMQDAQSYAYSLGLVGLQASLSERADATLPSNHFSDIGIDGSYRLMGSGTDVMTLNGLVVRERSSLDHDVAVGAASAAHVGLTSSRLNLSYYWRQTYGATVGYFATTGSSDALRYAGNVNNKPDTKGWVMQTDWTPFGKEDSWMAPYANLRLGVQYWRYDKFNGGADNVDGNGRRARDNNTWFLFAWLAI